MWGDAAPPTTLPDTRSNGVYYIFTASSYSVTLFADVLVDPYERPTYRQPLMDPSEWKSPTTEQQQAPMIEPQQQTTTPAADISGAPPDTSVYKQLVDFNQPGNAKEKMRYCKRVQSVIL